MNHPHTFDRKSLLVSVLLIVVIVMIAGGMAIYVLSDPAVNEALVLTSAAFRIDELYRDEVDWEALIVSARQGMFERLDRYSTYYQSQQFENLDEELTGSYSGIGVSVIFHEEGLMIMSVRENGPANEVGLLSGDIVVSVDSVTLESLRADESIGLLRGEVGSEVLVQIWRPATEELFEVAITRRKIPFMHIPFAGFTPDSLIYVRLLDFDAGATDDLEDALDSLLEKKDITPKGLILDLRGNPGGLFSEGYRTADLFLDNGVFMVGTDGRSRWNDRQYYSSGNDILNGLPIAVIVDHGTASSAEIVSGALQASGRASLVGDTTFGKGLVQGFVRFPNGDGLKLTISRYYFEGPIYLNDFDSTLNDVGHGLVPEHYYDFSQVNPLRRQLENSLLLSQFANRYQDEIVSAGNGDYPSDSLLGEFIGFARDSGFTFVSVRTFLAEEMKLLALVEESAPAATKHIDHFVQKSLALDDIALSSDKQYIKDRLLQIAYERKYGIYQTYNRVYLNTRPEIKLASRILLEGG